MLAYIVDGNSDILCPPLGHAPSTPNTQSVTKVQEYVTQAAVVVSDLEIQLLVLLLVAQSLGVGFGLELYSLSSSSSSSTNFIAMQVLKQNFRAAIDLLHLEKPTVEEIMYNLQQIFTIHVFMFHSL